MEAACARCGDGARCARPTGCRTPRCALTARRRDRRGHGHTGPARLEPRCPRTRSACTPALRSSRPGHAAHLAGPLPRGPAATRRGGRVRRPGEVESETRWRRPTPGGCSSRCSPWPAARPPPGGGRPRAGCRRRPAGRTARAGSSPAWRSGTRESRCGCPRPRHHVRPPHEWDALPVPGSTGTPSRRRSLGHEFPGVVEDLGSGKGRDRGSHSEDSGAPVRL
jgi:hypothetical protein